jgi:hypothetical protein
MLNPLKQLLEHFPEANWDWEELSKNPLLSWSSVERLPEKPWNWRDLSRNLSLTPEIILANLDKPWNLCHLYNNNSLSFEEVVELPELFILLNPPILFQTREITWAQFREHPELHHCFERLLQNPSIDLREILADPLPNQELDYRWISANPELDWQLIRERPEFDWNFCFISKWNRRITPEIVRDWQHRLDFYQLSSNPAVTLEIFEIVPEAPWVLEKLLLHTQDPRLIRKLLSIHFLPRKEVVIRKHLLNRFQRESPVALVRTIKNSVENSYYWKREGSLNSSLNWREVVSQPKNFKFQQLSKNWFHRYPDMQLSFRENSELCFRILLRGKQSSQSQLQPSLDLLRLRREDVLVRGCLNHKPRLLCESEEKN